ncbi:glycosyltransferase [Luteolibacter sp. AS25]|uniref:glycosyltransferase n=1 Tax=Luteolibacter sp. AS25 TaxID=3135776 RepID=UPI00398B9FC7
MKLILITHPKSLQSTSMPRFARMIGEGMENRGHSVQYWTSESFFGKIGGIPKSVGKWLGYIDQFVIFPWILKKRLEGLPADSLIVVADQALGMWVPHFTFLPHVVHVHDFMALRSALGEFPENPTGRSGKIYQDLIRRGFSKAKNFISVSGKTQLDLEGFLIDQPKRSEMVYNGVNPRFQPLDAIAARAALAKETDLQLNEGYLLHVGGNQWYKNRIGVILLYNAWRQAHERKIPLLLIGEPPSERLRECREASCYREEIHFVSGASDETIRYAYAGAKVFLFPSLAEGFGWPIAEAMASGCPVVTTDEAPMTEVAGEFAYLLPKMPREGAEDWAAACAATVEKACQLEGEAREVWCRDGITHTQGFSQRKTHDRFEEIYQAILEEDQV